MHATDYYLTSSAMLALAQLKDKESYPQIEKIFEESENPRLILYGAGALAEIGGKENFMRLLRKTLMHGMSAETRLEILCAIAELSGCGDDIYKFARLYTDHAHYAVQFLSELCMRDIWNAEFKKMASSFIAEFEQNRLSCQELILWMRSCAAENQAEEGSEIRHLLIAFLNELLEEKDTEILPKRMLLTLVPLALCRLEHSRIRE